MMSVRRAVKEMCSTTTSSENIAVLVTRYLLPLQNSPLRKCVLSIANEV